MALFLDVGPDDALQIGPDTFITVEQKSGKRARLRIISTRDVELLRKARLHEKPTRPLNPPSTEDGS